MNVRNIFLCLIGLAWLGLSSAAAKEFVMVSEGGQDVAPAMLRVVATDVEMYADMPTEIMIDLDKDGEPDLCLELVTTVSNTGPTGIQTMSTLRVKGRMGVDLGVSGPLGMGDIIRRGAQYYRTVSLARFQGNDKAKFFFGEWSQSPEEMTGILPIRMRGEDGMYLGFLALRLDGYGNVKELIHAISLEPLLALAVPPLHVPTREDRPRRDGGHPLLVQADLRIAMN